MGVPLWDVVASAGSIPELGVSAGKVENFAMMIKSFQTMLDGSNAYDLAMHVAKQSGLLKTLYDDKSVEGVSRYENLTELLNGIQEFVEDDESEKEKPWRISSRMWRCTPTTRKTKTPTGIAFL